MKEGWEIKKLENLFDVQSSKRVHKADWKLEGIPFYRAREVVKLAKYGFVENELFISEELFNEFTKEKGAPKEDDIVISAVGTLGECYLVQENDRFYIKDASVLWLSKKDYFSSRYIEYAFKSDVVKEQVMDKSMGATVGTLTISRAKNIKIPLPPLPEQQRIVSILDEAFAAIAKAKANAQQNLKNAKELFESYLEDLFSGIFESSETRPIKALAKVVGGYSFKSGDFEKSGKYQVIRMGNVRPGIIRENENPVFIDAIDEKALAKALLLPNDVIITQTGTKKKRDYGFTVIIEKNNYLLNQRIAAIRFSELYLSKFFLYFSWTNIFKDQYFANESGTVGQGNVGIGAITDSIVPFISVDEQKKHVRKIDAILAETKSLEAVYQKKMDDLEEMKKSVLQKAFAGELKVSELGWVGLKDDKIKMNTK